MTKEEIKNLSELIDLMLDKCILENSRTKVFKRLKEVCDLAIKALEQEELCEALHEIPSNEMNLEQARQAVRDLRKCLLDNYLLPESGDAVSRQAVLDLTGKSDWFESSDDYNDFACAVCNLPPVIPQPKTGHWIKISPAGIYECSECGQNVMTSDICAYKFCHGCGEKMVEPQESGEA